MRFHSALSLILVAMVSVAFHVGFSPSVLGHHRVGHGGGGDGGGDGAGGNEASSFDVTFFGDVYGNTRRTGCVGNGVVALRNSNVNLSFLIEIEEFSECFGGAELISDNAAAIARQQHRSRGGFV